LAPAHRHLDADRRRPPPATTPDIKVRPCPYKAR
jgi:hypothetical protein